MKKGGIVIPELKFDKTATTARSGSESSVNALVSLRDHFAGIALQGLMLRHNEPGYTDDSAAREAYVLADWMLKMREAN